MLNYTEETHGNKYCDDQRLAMYRVAMVNAAVESAAPTIVSTPLTETDGARYTWEGLSQGEKDAARERAILDYEKYNCWGRVSTWDEVKKQDPQAQIYTGTWVDKAIVREGKPLGKCRYTPRGFEEKGSWAGMYEAPTSASTTHRMIEAFGLAMRMGSFVIDFARAFFQGKAYETGTWEHDHVWMVDPIQKSGATAGHRVVRKLLKDVPGLRRAPQSWHNRLREVLINTGHVLSRTDAAI